MLLKKLQIEGYPDSYLSEIYQSVGMRFAFLSAPRNGNKQCHTFAKCRDFLHDAVRCVITGQKMSLYSFKYGPENPAVDLRAMRMLVRVDLKVPSEQVLAKWDAKMDSALKIINHYEKMAGVKNSRVIRIIGTDKTLWLFTGPAMWLKAPYLISMYTMLIRLGDKMLEFNDNEELRAALKKQSETFNHEKPSNDNDSNYLGACWDKLDLIIRNRELLFGAKTNHIYTKADIDISRFHNRSGIHSLCSYNTLDPKLHKELRTLHAEASKNG